MILQIEYLTKQYSHKDGLINAIDDINLIINRGDFVIITGPSGSGKSTLLLALFGLIKPTSGQIIFNNERIDNASDNIKAKIRKNTDANALKKQLQQQYPNAKIEIEGGKPLIREISTKILKHKNEENMKTDN